MSVGAAYRGLGVGAALLEAAVAWAAAPASPRSCSRPSPTTRGRSPSTNVTGSRSRAAAPASSTAPSRYFDEVLMGRPIGAWRRKAASAGVGGRAARARRKAAAPASPAASLRRLTERSALRCPRLAHALPLPAARVLLGGPVQDQPGPRHARLPRRPARHDRAGGMGGARGRVSCLDRGPDGGRGLGARPPRLPLPGLRPARAPHAASGVGSGPACVAGARAGPARRAPRDRARNPARRRASDEERARRRRRSVARRRRRRATARAPSATTQPTRRARRRRRRPRKEVVLARIAKASIERVVAAADMLEVVGQYTQLKKAGANYMGRCPFHEEKTPSFSVDPAEKLYYCFGCGEGGDLLSFMRRRRTSTSPERSKRSPTASACSSTTTSRAAAPTPTGAASACAASRAHARLLRAGAVGSAGGARRPRLPRRAWPRRGGLAAVPPGVLAAGLVQLRDAAAKKGFSEHELIDAGLVVPGKRGGVYDRFRGRLMFPLADERGRVLGFGARTLGDDKPKYLNSPETRSTTKARPCSASTAPRRAPPSSIACSWSRATPTSSRWCRPG